MREGKTPDRQGPCTECPVLTTVLGRPNEVKEPLRLAEIARHPRSFGFHENHPPMKTSLRTPIHHRGEILGNTYLIEKEGGRVFTPDDEETLLLFASRAAMAIVNARRRREDRSARTDLKALVALSPVGILIFDGKTWDLGSRNPEALRIVRGTSFAGLHHAGAPQHVDLPGPGAERSQ